MKRLTLEEIGRLAGVSRSTVSRVVNDHPYVSPPVRDRVSKVIAETGYSPDPAARSLARQRTGIVGLVVALAIESLFEDPFFPRLIQGVSRACTSHGSILSLILLYSREDEAQLHPTISQSQLFDGFIVAATRTGDPLIPQLLANGVSFVVHGRHDDPRASYVDVDNVAGSYTAANHLFRLGRRRIATITGPMDSVAALDRKRGFLSALRDRNHSVDEALIVCGDFSELSGYEAMQRLLPHAPDAVFVASDTMALGALRALREAGIRVPGDIAVVGFDDMPYAATAAPPLTTVRQPIRRAGTLAFEALCDIMDSGLEPPRRIVMPTELVIRESCGMRQAS
ncbi:MAG: LacI family DNA-binding transcriptional regulator [Anaerolineae bacterium]|jgi:LacI family transcriptional regulator